MKFDGARCPNCHRSNIAYEWPEFLDKDKIETAFTCQDCHFMAKLIYKLVKIEEIDLEAEGRGRNISNSHMGGYPFDD